MKNIVLRGCFLVGALVTLASTGCAERVVVRERPVVVARPAVIVAAPPPPVVVVERPVVRETVVVGH